MDPLLEKIAGQGILGIIVVILLIALRTVFKLYTEAQEKRIQEGVENRGVIERNTASVAVLTEVVKERLKG